MAEDRGPEFAAVCGLFLALTWLFVLLRLYVKAFISKSWAADDFLLVVSLIFFSTFVACAFSGIKYGTGRHLANIPAKDVPKGLYYWWLCELLYTITTVFIRLSIAVFLLRIAVKPLHRGIIYGTLGGVIVFTISYFFLIIFQCSPVSFFWGQYEGDTGICINPAAVPNASIAHSVLSFTADWILGLLPIFLIYDLQMNLRTKISVAGVLSLGLLAGVATMIRIPYIKVLALTDDFLYATSDVAIWSTVEPGLGIVAVGAATLRPLFRTFYAVSTRNKSSNHLTQTKHSKLRNSHMLAGAAQEVRSAERSQQAYKSSMGSDEDSEEIQLRTDLGATGMGLANGSAGVVITSSPFADENEMHGKDAERDGEWVGIQVHRTVEVSRTDGESVNSFGSEANAPWPLPGTGRSDKDMV